MTPYGSFIKVAGALVRGGVVAPGPCTTQDPNTVLLMHMDGADTSTVFTDNSPSGHLISAFGDAQVTTSDSVFGTGSLLLDGTGDHVLTPDSDDWNFGTGDFTWEARIKVDTIVNYNAIMGQYQDGNNHSEFFVNGVGKLGFAFVSFGTYLANYSTPSSTISAGTWYHVAVVRSGSSIVIYVDGVAQVMSEPTPVGGNSYPNYSAGFDVGRAAVAGLHYFDGRIDEVYVVKGAALYTSNFTPPTVPYCDAEPCLAQSASVVTHLHMDGTNGGTSFPDTTGRVWTVGGGAQTTTTDPKFGSAAYLGNGTDSRLQVPSTTDFQFDGEFTVDTWFKTGVGHDGYMLSGGASNSNAGSAWGLRMNSNGTVEFQFFVGTAVGVVLSPGTYDDDVYHHVAATRDASNVIRLFVDGTEVASTTRAGTSNSYPNPMSIGASFFTHVGSFLSIFNGRLDEPRIVKGEAVWTANFTPPTLPYCDS